MEVTKVRYDGINRLWLRPDSGHSTMIKLVPRVIHFNGYGFDTFPLNKQGNLALYYTVDMRATLLDSRLTGFVFCEPFLIVCRYGYPKPGPRDTKYLVDYARGEWPLPASEFEFLLKEGPVSQFPLTKYLDSAATLTPDFQVMAAVPEIDRPAFFEYHGVSSV